MFLLDEQAENTIDAQHPPAVVLLGHTAALCSSQIFLGPRSLGYCLAQQPFLRGSETRVSTNSSGVWDRNGESNACIYELIPYQNGNSLHPENRVGAGLGANRQSILAYSRKIRCLSKQN